MSPFCKLDFLELRVYVNSIANKKTGPLKKNIVIVMIFDTCMILFNITIYNTLLINNNLSES